MYILDPFFSMRNSCSKFKAQMGIKKNIYVTDRNSEEKKELKNLQT